VNVVSFSGIDGAGKSTQIDALCRYLESSGIRFSVLTFWDDIVVFGKFREHMSLQAFKGDKGVGSPEKPITRRDKNVTSWYLSMVRLALYTLDTIRLRSALSRARKNGPEFLIFDRYIYDELANLPLHRSAIRWYCSILRNLIPQPDIALLIDAEPEAAAVRKPEYPLEFVRRNRESYLQLSQMIGGISVVPPLPVDKASEMIRKIVFGKILKTESPPPVSFSLRGAVPSEVAKTSNH
jgi:thymidylate kinase